ncbi:MAG: homocysteine S-methyltransferase family protein [Polyangiaceae bacterium]|jgi:S-methylmethionine-dependent homocysteine/selenocysteine methylase
MSCVILDGPLGTELTKRGIALPEPAWTAHAVDVAPDAVAEIHRAYDAAGATVHTAATFRTQRRSVGRRWQELARLAVRIARMSVGPQARIAGSLAPLEDCYRPDRSPGRAARAEHRELAVALADEGVDLFLCETFATAIEAVVAVEEAARTGVETWVALTAGPNADLMSKAAALGAARDCVNAGARAVLVNCTPVAFTTELISALASLPVPVGAYANAGGMSDGLGWSVEPQGAARRYADFARRWVEDGATMVGGCCGTGPAHIAELARAFARPGAALSPPQWTSRTSTRP